MNDLFVLQHVYFHKYDPFMVRVARRSKVKKGNQIEHIPILETTLETSAKMYILLTYYVLNTSILFMFINYIEAVKNVMR